MTNELIPLYGFVRGDTLGVVVLARAEDTVECVSRSLARAVEVRVGGSDTLRLYRGDRLLDPTFTVQASGLRPLERIDLVMGGADGVSSDHEGR